MPGIRQVLKRSGDLQDGRPPFLAGTSFASPPAMSMRALVLNGALSGDEGLVPIEEALGATLGRWGWEVERVRLREVLVAYCKGCFDCWVKTPGVCATNDDAGAITRTMARSDLVALISPITFGGYSSELKKLLDRSIGIVSPFFTRVDGEVHHKPRYTHYPALLAIGVTGDRDPEEAQIFARLVGRNAINFHAPAHVVSIVSRDDSPEQLRTTIDRAVAQLTARKGAA